MSIQAVLFPRSEFEMFEVINFLHKHQLMPIKPAHITNHFIRVRIRDPKQFRRFITKVLDNDVELVIGYK
jgi:hypothetical protein